MSRRRLTTCLSLGLCGTLAVLTAAPAQPVKLPPDTTVTVGKVPFKLPLAAKPPAEVVSGTRGTQTIQTFPTNGKMQTAWKVQWTTMRGNGLVIKGAWFKRSPADDWIQVLGDARLAEAFVPYENNAHRFWDVSYGFGLDPLTKDDAGPNGQLLYASTKAKAPTVIKEIRDRGIMFKHPRTVRRGQTMLLWASLSAANYRYLIEYGFQDEGTITFRVGASGHNFGGSQWTPHMHNAMFRVDVNLGGPDHNSVQLCEHIEPDGDNPSRARNEHNILKEECAIDWDPQKFTMLRVINTEKKNIRGEPWSYDLMPLRAGNARHFGKAKDSVTGRFMEECTQHDFWVTRNKPGEMSFTRVPQYIKDREPIEDTDVVLWYTASCNHEPRSEDGEDRAGGFDGATHVMWCGFDLRPRNLFDRSPFYPYSK
jgi:primary-amine oxidase